MTDQKKYWGVSTIVNSKWVGFRDEVLSSILEKTADPEEMLLARVCFYAGIDACQEAIIEAVKAPSEDDAVNIVTELIEAVKAYADSGVDEAKAIARKDVADMISALQARVDANNN